MVEDLKDEDKTYGTIETARRIGVSLERMYYWEKKGILNPIFVKSGIREFRRYSVKDIEEAMLIKNLVDKENYTLKGALEIIKRLKDKTSQ